MNVRITNYNAHIVIFTNDQIDRHKLILHTLALLVELVELSPAERVRQQVGVAGNVTLRHVARQRSRYPWLLDQERALGLQFLASAPLCASVHRLAIAIHIAAHAIGFGIFASIATFAIFASFATFAIFASLATFAIALTSLPASPPPPALLLASLL